MNETFSNLDTIIQLSKDSDTEGFDLRAGTTWIYPMNYPIRDYQLNITQAALFNNTLVSLPTGLGKTFIAAVVMYNFYRWYPMGKIIFMAPTKPLVKQQMDACYNIMAIPSNTTAEMTGTKLCASRINTWRSKRVFFITPHILQNDIDTVLELASQIRCVVIDEAHKALGKNANCEAIKKLQKANSNFRILALSATPGSTFASVRDVSHHNGKFVLQVITNLLISHIECRTNESLDVMPYVFRRKLETIVVPLSGKLQEVKNQFIFVLDQYTRPLLQHNILSGNCANLTKGRIVLTMKDFKERGRHHPNFTYLVKTMNICVTLYHAYELLIRHGMRAFLTFLEGSSNALVHSIDKVRQILEDISNYLGPMPEIEMLPDGTIPEITQEIVLSHPKFNKLLEILLSHFKEVQGVDTKIMVFCEYRESVKEIYSLLLRHRPTIKPRVFLGQGAITQAQQAQVIKSFKSGACNTLVSTCIGEEGLDVGEVDLIVCFDIHTKSPIRMVQRMGRTGRKRDGRVVILVTEGKEQQTLDDCMRQKDNITSLLDSQAIKNCLYKNNPSMIPANFKPECNKMYITVAQLETPKKKEKKDKKCILKNMFEKINSTETSSSRISETRNSESSVESPRSNQVSNKRKSPVPKAVKAKKSCIYKQGDIRNMFNKISSSQLSQQSSEDFSEKYKTKITEKNETPDSLVCGIENYLDKYAGDSECQLCNNLFNCKVIDYPMDAESKSEWRQPDTLILNKITSESLNLFFESFTLLCETKNTSDKMEIDLFENSNIIKDKERTLEYFKLDQIIDIFSEDSSDGNADLIANHMVYNQSLGNFNTSIISTNSRTTSECQIQTENMSDVDIISDSDESPKRPLFKRRYGVKRKMKQPVFIHNSSTPNTDKTNHGLLENLVSSPTITVTKDNAEDDLLRDVALSLIRNNTPTRKLEDVEDKQIMCDNEANKRTENDDFQFWDESLFEVSDIDEDECNKLIEKVSSQNENENNRNSAQHQDEHVLHEEKSKNADTENSTENNANKVEAEDYDSDATIDFSLHSDDDFEDLKNKFEAAKTKGPNTKSNISEADVTNSTLLNITEIIELLDQMKKAKTEKENTENNKACKDFSQNETPLNSVADNLKNINLDKLNYSQRQDSVCSANKNISAAVEEDILKDCAFIVSDEEESLLAITQNNTRRRNKKMKLQLSLKDTKTKEFDNLQAVKCLSISQESPVKIPYKKKLNKPIVLSDSDDDDFEKPKWIKSSKAKIIPNKRIHKFKSLPDCKELKSKAEICQYKSTNNIKKTNSKKVSEFIEYEAEVENDENYVPDSQEESEDLLESSFVNDTQNIFDQTDMQAKYLQSVRSPNFKRGLFKIPQRLPPVTANIFSQIEPTQENTYQIDSFCVENDVFDTEVKEMSYLERMEHKLKQRCKKNKKRKRALPFLEDSV